MGSMDRSKKRLQLWKKAVVHFLLCFVMGFFTGFTPTGKPSYRSMIKSDMALANSPVIEPRQAGNLGINRSLSESASLSKVLETAEGESEEAKIKLNPRRQVIIITPTNDKDPLRGVLLRRMANTLKLVPPPLLWIVLESQLESSDVSEILRRTGVMYRHLVLKENFTDIKAETDHQRNLALKHIEHHRLSGIVHFAGLSNVYDLSFFEEIRAIEAFGVWPLAKLSAKRKKAIIEGPVCQSSQVIGWHLSAPNAAAEELANINVNDNIHISSFGFNSSILWDPERWGRLSSTEGTNQNSLKFVKQAVIEDETKLKGVPSDNCLKVNLWKLHFSTKTLPLSHVEESSFGGRQR